MTDDNGEVIRGLFLVVFSRWGKTQKLVGRVKESKQVAVMKLPPRVKAKQEKPPMVSGHALMLKVVFLIRFCV